MCSLAIRRNVLRRLFQGLFVAGALSFAALSAASASAHAADAPDLQVRPVVSSGASGCSAPAGQDPAAAQAATVPSFDAGSLTCYKLGPAQLDISQAPTYMGQWSPQGYIANIGLSNDDAAGLGEAAAANVAARPPSRCSAKSSKPCPSAPLATCTRSSCACPALPLLSRPWPSACGRRSRETLLGASPRLASEAHQPPPPALPWPSWR